MKTDVVEFVIVGTTLEGMQYSPFVHPVTASGVRCVVVDKRLEDVEPMAFRFLMSFAKDNALTMREGRVPERTELAKLQRAGDTG